MKRRAFFLSLLLIIYTLSVPASYSQISRGGVSTTGPSAPLQPLNTEQAVVYEEFCGGTGATGQVGTYGWNFTQITGAGASVGMGGSVADHPCHAIIQTGATLNNSIAMRLSQNFSGVLGPLSSTIPFDSKFAFQVDSGSVNERIGFCITGCNGDTPTDGIYLRYDSAVDTGGTFRFVARASGTETATDSGIAAAASTYYTMRIRSIVSGTILFSLTNPGGSVLNPEVSISTNVPTGGADAYWWIKTGAATNRTMVAEFFAFRREGITTR
jgi:hypothetical protein